MEDDRNQGRSDKIYSVLSALQPGMLGPNARVVGATPCPVCQQVDRPKVEHLDLMLDAWTPCDFVSVYHGSTFAVTCALRDKLRDAGVRGIVFRDMEVSRSETLEDMDPEHNVALPTLVQLDVQAEVAACSSWFEALEKCARCGRITYEPSADRSAASATTSSRRPKGPPRRIPRAAWTGEDMFWTLDPGPAVVTEKVKLLLEQSTTPGLILHPAELV